MSNDDYLNVLDSIRGKIDPGRLGTFVTKILRNESREYIRDYEVIDDVKDIVGTKNFELLREFVEVVLLHGVANHTFLTVHAQRLDAKARRKAASEMKKQQQSDASKLREQKKLINRAKFLSLDKLAEVSATLPPLPDWVKNSTGVK